MDAVHQIARIRSGTRRYDSISISDFEVGSAFLFVRDATEERARRPVWRRIENENPELCIIVEEQNGENICISNRGAAPRSVSLRDEDALRSVLGSALVYIDISGLSHHVWAPLLRVADRIHTPVRVVYVEPESYRPHPTPASPTLFDLSSSFGGLAPLPGFARLSGPADSSRTILVAMLGFEGNRPGRIAVEIDPAPKVVPIVGVPGFRMEYPSFTITCNRSFLTEHRAFSEIRFARASCPFSAYEALCDIQKDYRDHYIYIAPVGTKPHSLGAVWFAIRNPETTEIMYDFPSRKAGRTNGIGLTHVYDFAAYPHGRP